MSSRKIDLFEQHVIQLQQLFYLDLRSCCSFHDNANDFTGRSYFDFVLALIVQNSETLWHR